MNKQTLSMLLGSFQTIVTALQKELEAPELSEAKIDTIMAKAIETISQPAPLALLTLVETIESEKMSIKVKATPFKKAEGKGRKQVNPILTFKPFDLSEDNRKEFFNQIRKALGLDIKTQFVKHPKIDGAWVIKDEKIGQDIHCSIKLNKKGKKA